MRLPPLDRWTPDHSKMSWVTIFRGADLNGDEYLSVDELSAALVLNNMMVPEHVPNVWSVYDNGWHRVDEYEITISQMLDQMVANRTTTYYYSTLSPHVASLPAIRAAKGGLDGTCQLESL